VASVVADVSKMTSSITFRVLLIVGVVALMFSGSIGSSSTASSSSCENSQCVSCLYLFFSFYLFSSL
jgi:hypothetical protein